MIVSMVRGPENISQSNPNMPFFIHSAGKQILDSKTDARMIGVFNDFIEFSWCTAGEGEIVLFGQHLKISAGDVFYYLPGEEHELISKSENWTLYFIAFNGPLAPSIMLSYKYQRVQHASGSFPEELFTELISHTAYKNPLEGADLCGITLRIIAQANAYRTHLLHSNKRVNEVMRFIQDNLSVPNIGIDYIADDLKIPRSTLCKLFERETGRNLGEYLRNERYQRALALLRNTNLPITEIAQSVGYTEMPSFSRLIRRGTGFSPTEYRNQNFILKE